MQGKYSIEALVRQVTVDCKDDGTHFTVEDRLQVIQSLLAGSDYQLVHRGDLCLLYAKQEVQGEEVVLVSSHVDCVYGALFCEEVSEECLRGTFDNSLTNGCLLYAMLTGSLPEQVVVAFTGDEEHDSAGAYEVAGWLREKDCYVRQAWVLDVTNEGWAEGCPFSLENDLGIHILRGYQIVTTLAPYLYKFVPEAEPDESWDYDEMGIPTCSLCLPVSGDLHADAVVLVRRSSLPIYCEILCLLAHLPS